MNNKTINLTEWFSRQSEWQKRVAEDERRLLKAQWDLKNSNTATKRIVLKQLDKGQSTGDSLQDEAFRVFGLNKEVLGRLVAFSNRLIQSKGKELLIVFPYRLQVRFSEPGDERESGHVDCRGYFFGILSGERLELMGSNDGDFEVVIPFERYIIRGFSDSSVRSSEPNLGKFTLKGCYLLGFGKLDAGLFIESVIAKKGAGVSIFIGEDVGNQTILHSSVLDEIRKVLHSATPEEQIVGTDI